MENLEQFRSRTEGFMRERLPRGDWFETSAGLTNKVDGDGRFRKFCGNTVIFELEAADVRWLRDVQRALHAACGECLAEPIAPETFHITLHDLLSGPPDALDAAQLAQVGRRAKEVLLRIRGRFPEEIHLRPVSIFNMVNTSLVAGFAPATEADCATLMGLYEAFQQVVRLPYHLTPHATIAYFRPGRYGRDQMARLQSAIDGAPAIDAGRSIRLELSRLHYCDFEDMNHYWREGAAPRN